jgi:peroxiredoxin
VADHLAAIGRSVPDLAFVATDGRDVRLSEFRGEATALIFMRHLG